MVRHLKAWLGAVCLYCAPLAVAAHQDDAGQHARALQPMVVRSAGTLPPTPGQIDLLRYNGFVRVIDRSEFDARFVSLSELLEDALGVQVRQLGGLGGYAEVTVRASTSKQLSVFVDGVPLSSAQNASLNLNLVPVSVIERIEIYPDFTPVQLASGNLGGAINIVTRQLGQEQAQVTLSAGSFGTLAGRAAWFGGSDRVRLAAGAEAVGADNNYPFTNQGGTPDNPRNHFADHRRNNAFRQGSGFFKAHHELTDMTRLQWSVQHVDANKEIPTLANRPADQASLASRLTSLQSDLSTRYSQWQVDHGVSLGEDVFEFSDPRRQFTGSSGVTENRSRRVTSRHIAYREHDHQRVTMALELQQEFFTKWATQSRVTTLDNQRRSAILGIQHESDWLDDSLTVTLLGRSYWVADRTRQPSQFVQEALHDRDQLHEQSWYIGTALALGPHWQWRTNVARGVRIPTLFERFGEAGQTRPNAELKPERSLNLETGLVWDGSAWHGLTWQLAGVLFAKRTTNHIVLSVDTSGRGKLLNMGDTETQGVEARLDGGLGESWAWSVGMVALSTDNQVNVKSFYGKQLPGIYHRQAFASLGWNRPDYALKLSYRHDSDLIYEPTAAQSAPPRNIWDIHATGYWQQWTMNLSINNVFNRQAMDFHRFENVGRAWFLSLTYDW